MQANGENRLSMLIGRWFPERHIYLRSGGDMYSLVLSSAQQAALAGCVLICALATAASLFTVAFGAVTASAGEQAAIKTKAYYERLIADRQARLNSAVAALSSNTGSVEGLAQVVEARHAALATLLTDIKGAPGAASALAPVQASALQDRSPAAQIQAVQQDQERMVTAAEGMARTRADRLKLAFRLAGLDPAAYAGHANQGSLGGPLIEAKDPRALAAVLDVDTGFAARIQSAAQNLSTMRSLADEEERLPLGEPVTHIVHTSGFGARIDPFTHHTAFHPGQDFAGAYMTTIEATAPGVVSFTGQRNGYGNVVEIDHGGGFKTRYAHLQGISVAMGQKVGVGQKIGAMGSTGRSTGVHLHYEVWENGRVQDPTRFLKAGDYVQQNQ